MDGKNNIIQLKTKDQTSDKNKHVYKDFITRMFMTLLLHTVTSS